MNIKSVFLMNNDYIHVIFTDDTKRIIKTYIDKNGVRCFDAFHFKFIVSDFL